MSEDDFDTEDELPPCPEVLRTGEHCYHPTMHTLMSIPPQVAHTCCWCGGGRVFAVDEAPDLAGHGPYSTGQPPRHPEKPTARPPDSR